MNRRDRENTTSEVAVVVALNDPATPTLRDRLVRFAEEVGPSGEVWLVDGSGTSAGQLIARGLANNASNVRVITRSPKLLAPMLWREGLLATDAPLVAFTTAAMMPQPGWLAALKAQLQATNAAGVGGPIEPGSGLSKTDRAVALLRYSRYFPSTASLKVDPPGDNALYHRDRLMAVASSWLDGFWEADVHHALREKGKALTMAGSAVVTFGGGVGLVAMTAQRWRHARRYGFGRSKGMSSWARLSRVLAAPMVPLLLCDRIRKSLQMRGMSLRPWLGCGPRLIWLATSWAIGEAVGTLLSQPARQPPLDQQPDPVTQLT